MRCVRATQFLKSWELSSLLNKMETGLPNVNLVCQKETSSSIISNGGHWGTCDEHFVKDPKNNFKISNCNKLSSTYLLCICGSFFFALCLLIHNNKLKHRKANDRINFRACTTGNVRKFPSIYVLPRCRHQVVIHASRPASSNFDTRIFFMEIVILFFCSIIYSKEKFCLGHVTHES